MENGTLSVIVVLYKAAILFVAALRTSVTAGARLFLKMNLLRGVICG
jgi:hypothetical protein